jgi:hypothetical protein
MAPKGKRLVILAGLAPPRSRMGPDRGDDEAPPDADADDSGEYKPSPEVLSAAEDALGAAKDDDHEGFAVALCKLIDAHAEAKAAAKG